MISNIIILFLLGNITNFLMLSITLQITVEYVEYFIEPGI